MREVTEKLEVVTDESCRALNLDAGDVENKDSAALDIKAPRVLEE